VSLDLADRRLLISAAFATKANAAAADERDDAFHRVAADSADRSRYEHAAP
jgi:hypothetical protein